MKHIEMLVKKVSDRLTGMAGANAVMAKAVSLGDCHVVPLCELSVGFGSGGGIGEADGETESEGPGKGLGGGAGGGVKVQPVAVLIVDGNEVRLDSLLK